MLRTFGIEVLVCPQCCGVRRVLLAMGLSSLVPEQAGCRSPPTRGEFAYVDEGVAVSRWERCCDLGRVVAGER